ncbi:MAG: hypothetical protein ABL876_04165 [Chitinophagaceae bacterium]
MSNSGSIKIKAAFLLAAFGLNTVIGFACSIGLDMGFNSKDYHDEEATEAVVHIHDDGKKHVHYEKKKDHDKSHHHDQENTDKSKDGKDNCCTDKVQQVEKLDKSLPHSLTIIHPIFLIAFFDVFYNVSLPTNDFVKNIKQFVRSYHPPIPDIRIAIQSFQI